MKTKISLLLSITLIIFMYSCNFDDYNVPDDKTASLEIYIHDAPAPVIMELNLMFSHITLDKIDEGNNVIDTLGDEPGEIEIIDKLNGKSLNILEYTQNNPVLLSRVAGFTPGRYRDLRIKLDDGCTVGIDHDDNGKISDNERHKLVIDYGHVAELVWAGPFEVPADKLFRIDVDFDVNNSVCFEPGVGYVLVPVIRVTEVKEVKGIYKGQFPLQVGDPPSECVVQFLENNKCKAKTSKKSNYTVYGKYKFNQITRLLTITDLDYVCNEDCPNWFEKLTGSLFGDLLGIEDPPDEVVYPISEWGNDILDDKWENDRIVAIDPEFNKKYTLYRVNSFDLGRTFTKVTITADFTCMNENVNGKAVAVSLIPVNGAGAFSEKAVINSDVSMNLTFQIDDNYIDVEPNDSIDIPGREYVVTAYLAEKFEDITMSMKTSMINGKIIGTSYNKWKGDNIVNVIKGQVNNFSVKFPPKLNIRLDPDDFSTSPTIRWDPIQENCGILPTNLYFVACFVEMPHFESTMPDGTLVTDGNERYDMVFNQVIDIDEQGGAFVKYSSWLMALYDNGARASDGGQIMPILEQGSPFIVQIMALEPDTTELDTKTGKGIQLIDTNIFYKN